MRNIKIKLADPLIHTVARESQAAFEQRLATLDNQEHMTRERVKYVFNRAYINSNSALMKGTCVGELGGWLENYVRW